jgi:deoxyribonuclease-4
MTGKHGLMRERGRSRRLGPSADGLLLGAHFSIAGGLHKALYTARDYGCTAVQIFTKNASTWKERVLSDQDIENFDVARQETGVTAIASHTAYLINLGSPEKNNFDRAVGALRCELVRSFQLSIPWVVHHPGAHMGTGEAQGIARIAEGINRVLHESEGNGPQLLLETCAGQGTTLGHRFEQLAAIWEKVEQGERVGFCLDTCHIFAAGYDIRTEATYHATMEAFDKVLGLERLKVIHINDALRKLGSRIDRHAHIGKGKIGALGFSLIMNDERLAHIPKILETPKKADGIDWDQKNLSFLAGLLNP